MSAAARRRVVLVDPRYIDVTGSLVAAYMLSQIEYYDKNFRRKDGGWFYMPEAQWLTDLRLTRHQYFSAKDALKACGLIEIDRRGVHGYLHFRLDRDALKLALENPAAFRNRTSAIKKKKLTEVKKQPGKPISHIRKSDVSKSGNRTSTHPEIRPHTSEKRIRLLNINTKMRKTDNSYPTLSLREKGDAVESPPLTSVQHDHTDDAVDSVMRACGFAKERWRAALRSVLALWKKEHDSTAYAAAGEMIAAWEFYVRSGAQLRYPWKPVNFFVEGHWLHPETWPWKETQSGEATVGMRRPN